MYCKADLQNNTGLRAHCIMACLTKLWLFPTCQCVNNSFKWCQEGCKVWKTCPCPSHEIYNCHLLIVLCSDICHHRGALKLHIKSLRRSVFWGYADADALDDIDQQLHSRCICSLGSKHLTCPQRNPSWVQFGIYFRSLWSRYDRPSLWYFISTPPWLTFTLLSISTWALPTQL